ncbi:MAG: hypothetical protein V7668_05870, partial [Cereibacter changlensis]
PPRHSGAHKPRRRPPLTGALQIFVRRDQAREHVPAQIRELVKLSKMVLVASRASAERRRTSE